MNRIALLLPVTLAAVFYSSASQAQTPGPVPSAAASTGTLNIPARDVPASNAQVSDGPEAANSVRIVRLSQASGKVQMDRNVGVGFEAAFNNLPITQGARLKTGEGSAEVEFEDGTTLRLIPDTQVDFKQLVRSASGATLSSMNVVKGTVYVSLSKMKGNTFNLTSGDGFIKPRPGAHLRVEIRDPESRVSVITGTADVTNTAGSYEVGKMKSLIFNTATPAPADVIAGIEDAPFDTWDEQQAEYHKRYSRGNALSGSGSSYGLADLNYYGSFSDVGGCGNVWRPYFTSAAWDPYASGVWAWYPGGYSWVSPYPWGWAPFHYGSWMQCGGGWGWQPGGGWYGLGNVRDRDRDRRWDHGGHHHPHDPIHLHPIPPRPHPGSGKIDSMVAVNEKPLTFSHVDRATRTFDFRNDSAGLGVPRGEFGKLNKLSETAGRAGSSNVPLFPIPSNRTDLAPVGSGGLTVRGDKAQGARTEDHAGFFDRPGNQNRDVHNGYAEREGSNLSNVQLGVGANGPSTPRAAGLPIPTAGYAGGNHEPGDRGSNGGYGGGQRNNNSAANGYSRGSSASGGYSGGSHPGANTNVYAGGGGGYSGGSHAAGAGSSAGGGGGSHAPAPAPSTPAPSAAPSSPTGHR